MSAVIKKYKRELDNYWLASSLFEVNFYSREAMSQARKLDFAFGECRGVNIVLLPRGLPRVVERCPAPWGGVVHL